ncbi:hypothetical protein JM654_03775 [Microbacterium oxydans]|nr:hypothetical protein [Microbacterium oxydans]
MRTRDVPARRHRPSGHGRVRARWAQMSIFVLAAGVFYVRWYEIRDFSFEPRR